METHMDICIERPELRIKPETLKLGGGNTTCYTTNVVSL